MASLTRLLPALYVGAAARSAATREPGGGHERRAAGSRSQALRSGRGAAATARPPPPARLGFHPGDRFRGTLRSALLRLRRLSHRLRAVDGERAVALRRSARRSVVRSQPDQHVALRRRRCERDDVLGVAAVRLLPATPLVDQGSALGLRVALDAPRRPSLHLVSLDAGRRGRSGRSRAGGAVRRRRSDLVQSLAAGAWSEHRRLRLEVDAVLDRRLSRRPNGHSPGRLRRGRGRWRRRCSPLRPRHASAAGEPLSRLHPAVHDLGDGRVHHRVFRFRWRTGVVHGRPRDARLPVCVRRRQPGARRRDGHVGAPAPGPRRHHADARAADEGRAAVSVAMRSGGRVHRRIRLRRLLTEASAITLGIVLVVWTMTPVYNMLLIALDPEQGEVEFSGNLWPPEPSLESFRVVLTQDARYLEHFWRQLGNSLYIGLATMVVTMLIASLASFAAGRMRLGRSAVI